MGNTQLSMECPGCQKRVFEVYFTDGDSILPRGSVWVRCPECKSYWIGTIELEGGVIKGRYA